MKILHLSIIVAIGIGACASLGTFILLTPHNTENVPVASTHHSYFMGVAVNPVTDKMYVCNYLNGSVNVYSGHYPYNKLDTIPIHGLPFDVTVNPVTNKIYSINKDSDNVVSVIDGITDTVIKSINVADMGKKPTEMVFDASKGGKTYKIWPAQVAVNPKTNRIYVSDWNYGDGVVTVIDGRNDQVIDTITGLGGGSYGIGVNPYTDRIYVDNVQYGYRSPYEISVIDGATDKILTNVTIGLMGPHGVSTVPGPTIAPLAVNPSTGLIYAACAGCMTSGNSNSENLISVINGTTNTVVGEIPLSALDISVNPNTNTVYATLDIDPITFTSGSSQVAVIDGQNNSVISYQESNKIGSSVAVNPQNDFVYITGNDRNSSSITQFYIGR